MYLKLMIDGVTSGAFSAIGLGPWPEQAVHYVEKILDHTRTTYSRPRALVEKHILEWTLGGAVQNQSNNQRQEQSREQQPRQEPRREQRSEQPRREEHLPARQPRPVLASTPRYVAPLPPMPEIPKTNSQFVQQPHREQKVHNPFKQAFQELDKPEEEPVVVQPTPVVKKEVDADTLKNILGV